MSADFEQNLLAGVYRAHATTDRCRWTDMGNEMISSIKWKVIDFFEIFETCHDLTYNK